MTNPKSLLKEIDGLKKSIEGIGRQKVLFISSLHNTHFHLKTSISVSLEYDSHQFIAYAPDLDIYGCGDTEYEAVEDLRESIIDLYLDLKEEKLGPDLQRIYEYLSPIIEEK